MQPNPSADRRRLNGTAFITIIASVLVSASAVVPASAGDFSVAWDPNSETDLEGYRVYYGTSSGSYTSMDELGLVTEHTLTGLADCTDWYVAVKAFDVDGEESVEYSSEVFGWPRPTTSSVVPETGEQGGSYELTLTGMNYRDASTVEFTHPGITVDGTVVDACGQLRVQITIAPDADLTTSDIDVIHPDGVYGTAVSAFTVVAATLPPTVTSHPQPQSVQEGDTATFSVTADGSAPLAYQWRKNGADIAGATASTYTTPPTTLADDGATFDCVVSNAAGSDTSNAALLTVTAAPTPPTVTSHPAPQTVTEGETATFTVAADGTEPLSYQWQRDGVDISGATSSSYTTPPTTLSDDGAQFRCVVTNEAGSDTSDVALLTVNPAATAPSVTSHPEPQTVVEGETATFTVAADGTEPLSYQWQRDGVDISGATSSSYTTPPTTLSDDGAQFRCVVSNEAGSDTSNAARLTVNDGTAPQVTAMTPADGAVDVAETVSPAVDFDEAMDPATVTSSTVRLLDADGNPVAQAAGSPVLSTDGRTATITPAEVLTYQATYRIQAVGGSAGVKDTAGNALAVTETQANGFTIVDPPTSPPEIVNGLRRVFKRPSK